MLILGPPGSGKSDLVLRLIEERGWRLVGDDQLRLDPAGDGTLRPAAPPPLRGLLEVRGLGIFRDLPVEDGARLRLAVHLAARDAVARLPEPAEWTCAGCSVPAVTLHAFDASAPAKVALALAAATGRAAQAAGAFGPPAPAP